MERTLHFLSLREWKGAGRAVSIVTMLQAGWSTVWIVNKERDALCQNVQTSFWTHPVCPSFIFSECWSSFRGIKQLGQEGDHSPPSIEGSYTSTPLNMPSQQWKRQLYFLTFVEVQKTLASFIYKKTPPLHTCLCNLLHPCPTPTLKMEITIDKTMQHTNPEDRNMNFLCAIHFCFYKLCDMWKLVLSYPHTMTLWFHKFNSEADVLIDHCMWFSSYILNRMNQYSGNIACWECLCTAWTQI